jgi:hypothetical protein
MAVSLSLDVDAGVWTLSQKHTWLLDGDSFATWREQLLDALDDLDRSVDLLVDLDGVTLHPSIAPAYALVICRTPMIRMALYYNADAAATAALKLAFPYVRLCSDRASAIAKLEDLRGDRAPLRRSGTVLSPSAVRELLASTPSKTKVRR